MANHFTMWNWNSEKTIQLCELLQSTSCLWKQNSPDFKNRNKRIDAIQTLAIEFEVDYHEIDKKIRNLRTQFWREHKKVEALKKSGNNSNKVSWFGYEHLLFLLQDEETDSRLTDDLNQTNDNNEEKYESSSDSEDHENTSNQDIKPSLPTESSSDNISNNITTTLCNHVTKRRAVEDKAIYEACDVMKIVTETVLKRDEYTVFGELIAHKLRNCGKDRYELAIAQNKISGILFDLEMGVYDRPI